MKTACQPVSLSACQPVTVFSSGSLSFFAALEAPGDLRSVALEPSVRYWAELPPLVKLTLSTLSCASSLVGRRWGAIGSVFRTTSRRICSFGPGSPASLSAAS
jgi:hypothetical protein